MNKQCAAYCIDLIRCLLQEKEIPQLPDAVSLQELYTFAKLHNVEAMVMHGLEQLDIDETDPVWQDWQNRANMLLTQSIVQMADRDALYEILPSAGIALLPVKGCWLKEVYPEIDWRQMSDLDMLIPQNKAQEAKKIMLASGYQINASESEANETCYRKDPYTKVELHVCLLHEDIDYYEDVWQRAEPVAGRENLYRFRPEDEYIFYFLHLQQHLSASGTGIRSILDSVVYRTAWPNMNRSYLEEELQKLKLWEMAVLVEQLADCWFKTGSEIPDGLLGLAGDILASGTYGTFQNYISRQRMRYGARYKNPVLRMLAYAVDRTCRPRKEMELNYPILKKLPFLLPVYWVIRAVPRFRGNYRMIWFQLKRILGKEEHHG